MWQVFERWREVSADWRNQTLQNPAFQRWAAGFWLTRWRARREAAEIFDLVAGFIYSQVLLALVRAHILQELRRGSRTDKDLRDSLGASGQGLSELAIDTLLKAAVSLELLETRSQARWALGSKGAALLGNPGVLAMIEHHAVLYQDLTDPLALLRAPRGESRLSRYWAYATRTVPSGSSASDVEDYTRLMAASQSLVAEEILDAYDFSRHRQLLDVGGGDGSFLRAVGARYPALKRQLFDLPAVAMMAAGRGDESPVEIHGGDFTRDSLPEGADLITLVRILHDHDDERVLQLLAAIRRVLPPHGCLLIAEPLADTAGARRMGHAYFGFYLFAMGSGRPRTLKEISKLLEKTGFLSPREYATRIPLQTRVLVSRPAP
jgi:demethylspheroidene O-methyltransferase